MYRNAQKSALAILTPRVRELDTISLKFMWIESA